jgi:hypothetical protein
MSTERVMPSPCCLQLERVRGLSMPVTETAVEAASAIRWSPGLTAWNHAFLAPPHLAFGGTNVPPRRANP